jgi:hypothetical protein
MQSVLRKLTVVLVVVVAATTAVAATATAAPEWYVKKAGAFAKVTTPVAVTTKTTWEVIDTKTFGIHGLHPLAVRCEGSAEDVLETGGKGQIKFLGNNSGCTRGTVENNICERAESVEQVDLAWTTELYKEGTTNRDKIISGVNGTLPEVKFFCQGFPRTDTCESKTSMLTTNNTSAGLVETAFDKISNKVSCSISAEFFGEALGEWKGLFKVEPKAGSGVEAIKVE